MSPPLPPRGVAPHGIEGLRGQQQPVGRQGPAYRPDIDGLRGIAVLAVVGFHAYPAAVPGGFVGVDVFFVISGFLITGIILDALRRQSFSVADFYIRRVRRIFPALLIVLVSFLLAGWFVLLSGEYRQLGKHTAFGAFFLSNFALWRESGYFDASAELKPLLHLWSLSIEEQFYLAWPLLLVIFSKFRRGLFVLTGFAITISLLSNLGLAAEHPTSAFYLPHARLWELQLGGLLALIAGSPAKASFEPAPATPFSRVLQRAAQAHARLGSLSGWLGLLMIAAAIMFFDRGVAYPGWRALIPALGTSLIISAAGSSWMHRRFLANRALVWVGLISYPLYLWHWPMLAFARIVGEENPSGTTTLAIIGLSFVLAWLTYRFIEKPIRSARSRMHQRGTPLALVLGMIITGLAGAAVFGLGGLPDRFPKVVQHLTDYRYDFISAYRGDVCFIEKVEQIDRALNFSSLCVDEQPDTSPSVPRLVLWGDSMAAHLYPGLSAQRNHYRFRIAQFTTAACPPILGYSGNMLGPEGNALCAKVNQSTAARIKSIAPDSVILAANGWSADDLPQLQTTVDFLRASGAARIVIVGPVPRWTDALPKLLYRQFRSDPLHRIPRRMTFGLNEGNAGMDAQWKDIAKRLSVDYVSAMDVLCNGEGCMTRVGDSPDQLTAWDFGHLTSAGSAFLVERIFPALFSRTPERNVPSTAPDAPSKPR